MTQLFRSNNHVALSRNLLPEALCPLATTGGRQCPVILRWPNRCMGMKEADNLKVGSIRVKSQKTLIWLPIPPERSLSQIASMYLIICSGTLIAGWIFANADHFMQRTCQCSARGDIQLSICLVPDSSATMYFLGTQHWSLFDQEREREREREWKRRLRLHHISPIFRLLLPVTYLGFVGRLKGPQHLDEIDFLLFVDIVTMPTLQTVLCEKHIKRQDRDKLQEVWITSEPSVRHHPREWAAAVV